MKGGPLWRVAVRTAPEAEDAVGELLADLLGQPPAIYTDAKTGQSTVTVFCASRRALSPAKRKQLAAGLERIRDAGRGVGPARFTVSPIRREDWAESWKRHFPAVEIGRSLLIQPSWSRRRARKGQAVVVLDPGLSFGTGQHPTTAFCLRQLVSRRRPGRPQSFLDLGTGSGILAIAAAKLGYWPVRALDFDPEAVRVARQNARQNGVARRIHLATQDLTQLPLRSRERYDVICANLVSTLLVAERERLLNRLRGDGVLVIAGILRREFAEVRQAYRAAGLKLIASRGEKEWRSGAFAFSGDGAVVELGRAVGVEPRNEQDPFVPTPKIAQPSMTMPHWRQDRRNRTGSPRPGRYQSGWSSSAGPPTARRPTRPAWPQRWSWHWSSRSAACPSRSRSAQRRAIGPEFFLGSRHQAGRGGGCG